MGAGSYLTRCDAGLPPCPAARRMDPLWNSVVVGGFYAGKPFLGTVGMIGTSYTDAHLATGECCPPTLARRPAA